VDIFPDDVAYAALGHLHLSQKVGGREGVRYAGSTIPLALDEERYTHQVALVELDGPDLLSVTSLKVPRAVDVLRVPKEGPGPLDEVLSTLLALPLADGLAVEVWPWLEVRVALDAPEPMLRQRVDEALAGRAARLLALRSTTPGDGKSLADSEPLRHLRELTEEEVFLRRWAQDYETEPPPHVMEAWHWLVEKAYADEGGER
jgi:exonuclease SbcD